MAVSAEEIEAARDLFSGLGDITTRKMMGGLCLYHEGTIFAILMADGGLFLKGQGAFAAELEAAGCTQWSYRHADRDKPTRMAYWTMPDEALDDPDLACDWARRALAHL
ncbi:TfoX/Sxy family protein [Roseicyclus sp.]|uniref:TfoX/Sxy family protein n=1 Tax=Roseicyclus sp. TaxID=1914329 RepID=UPI003FA02466